MSRTFATRVVRACHHVSFAAALVCSALVLNAAMGGLESTAAAQSGGGDLSDDRNQSNTAQSNTANESGTATASKTGDLKAMIAAGPGGLRRHVSGRWATLNVSGANPTDEDVEESIVVSVGDQSRLQYERKMWIPSGARRQAWLPIQIPSDLSPDAIHVPLNSMRLKTDGDGEQFQSNFVGEPIMKRSLLIDHDQSVATLIVDRSSNPDEVHPITKFQRSLVYTARGKLRLSEQELNLPELPDDRVPPPPDALDAVDQVIVGSNRIFRDSAAVSQISRWLHSGGRLWIMLDRVDSDVVHQLLGDEHCFTPLDTVQLNDFELEKVDVLNSSRSASTESWQSETPATLLRVFTKSKDVSAHIHGWPAAFWQPVGQGEVLLTTLDASGWFQNGTLDGNTLTAFHSIATRFFSNRTESVNHLDQLAPIVDKQIGYTIPSRGSIAGVLGLHAVVLLAIGTLLMKQRRLHLLAVAVPILAFVATGTLFFLGTRQSGSIPPSVATGQISMVSTDGSHSHVETIGAVFSNQRQPLPIASDSKTRTELVLDRSDGETKRLVWDDSGRATWRFVTQRPGTVQHTRSVSVAAHRDPVTAVGTFDSKGFVGSINGLQAVEDPVIVSAATPSLALKSDGDRELHGSLTDVLPPGRFIRDGLLSQVQQSRQQFLQTVVNPDRDRDFTQPPLLWGSGNSVLAWAPNGIPSGTPSGNSSSDWSVSYGDGYQRSGWSLLSIPVQLRRPKSGEDFRIPATFVRLDSYVGTSGVSTIYNARTGTWLAELTKPRRVDLRCILPPEVLPCRVTKISVAIKINAPSRTLTVESISDESPVVMFSKPNPTGLQLFEVEDESLLQQATPGEINLSVAVSATEEEIASGIADVANAPRQLRGPDQNAETPDVDPIVVDATLSESRSPSRAQPSSRSGWSIDYMHVNVYATSE